MIDKDAFSIVSEIIRTESFYDPRHQKIYKAIENVGKAGGYVYVMQTGSLPYISDTLSKDITAEVKAELNKMK